MTDSTVCRLEQETDDKFFYIMMLGHTHQECKEIQFSEVELLGDFDKWILRVIGPHRVKVLQIYYKTPYDGINSDILPSQVDILPDHSKCIGAILTGSACDVSDIEENGYKWCYPLIDWIKQAYTLNTPIFGICFGHQLISHILGGRVGYLPNFPLQSDPIISPVPPFKSRPRNLFETSTRPIFLTHAMAQDPIFGHIYQVACENTDVEEVHLQDLYSAYEEYNELQKSTNVMMLVHTTHGQTVQQAPPTSICFAFNNMDKNHFLKHSDYIYSTQFHPEFNTPAMKKYVELGRSLVELHSPLQGSYDKVLNQVRETNIASQLLVAFYKYSFDLNKTSL